jgi:hypothetical protein
MKDCSAGGKITAAGPHPSFPIQGGLGRRAATPRREDWSHSSVERRRVRAGSKPSARSLLGNLRGARRTRDGGTVLKLEHVFACWLAAGACLQWARPAFKSWSEAGQCMPSPASRRCWRGRRARVPWQIAEQWSHCVQFCLQPQAVFRKCALDFRHLGYYRLIEGRSDLDGRRVGLRRGLLTILWLARTQPDGMRRSMAGGDRESGLDHETAGVRKDSGSNGRRRRKFPQNLRSAARAR